MKYVFSAVYLFILMILLSGCGAAEAEHGRFYDAVADGVMASNPGISEISFYEFAVTDSVTVGRQMAQSMTLFRTKRDHQAAVSEKYLSQNKVRNAAVWKAKAEHADSILSRLDSLSSVLPEDSVAYYICRFSGSGSGAGSSAVFFDRWYATVSPDGRVFNITGDSTKVGQGMASALWLER